jgi:hypothetical protein
MAEHTPHRPVPNAMKKALLILLMMLLPWQAYAAMERNLVHVLGDGHAQSMALVVKHMAEHAAHVLHHHDDDGDDDGAGVAALHEDDSQKSVQHLADYDHGCGLHILMPAYSALPMAPAVRSAPPGFHDTYSDRTTLPLLRPPRPLA